MPGLDDSSFDTSTFNVFKDTTILLTMKSLTTSYLEGQFSIYYLDANNLYGGAMHRMIPYELVDVIERREVTEKINRDPNRLIQSLKMFGKYGFFIGFAILDMSKHIIYHFYYNVLKTTFDNVELLGQDIDSLIVQLSDKGNIVHKMCDMYKSFDFSELDNTSYFYGELVKYYDHEVDKSKFPSLESFLNFNKKLPGPIFKDEHNGHRITEFVGLRPKMYCLVDEKHVKHNAAKGVPRNVVIDCERMSVKNIELYKRVFEAEKKEDAVIEGSFKRINNQAFDISTKEQTKTLMTCTDNKRWILDDNVNTLAFNHYRLKDM